MISRSDVQSLERLWPVLPDERDISQLTLLGGEDASARPLPPALTTVGRISGEAKSANSSRVALAGRAHRAGRSEAESKAHQAQTALGRWTTSGGWAFGPLASTVAKRVFDLSFAVSLLLLSLPILIAIAAVVRLTSPGPIIYRQVRCGLGGRTFVLFKFRTMIDKADRLVQVDPQMREAYTEGWKLMNDPRLTSVGGWLRRTSLDELPQLLNVLRGEMSVVGPRPVQVDELLEQYGSHAIIFDQTKPGLTGLWQVSGRSSISYAERIALDLDYVRRRSFWFDLLLVLRTIPVVIFGRGAV